MKKNLIVLVSILFVGIFLLSGCDWFATEDRIAEIKRDACFDMGGLIDKDNKCVLSNSTSALITGDCTNLVPAGTLANTCEVKLSNMGAPVNTITAICNGTYGTVSQRLTSGTFVPIGSLTFDNEYRVWFLTDWKVPATANYSFSYEGAEKNFFDAPFVLGSELGYKNGTRVPFEICWDVTSPNCKLPDGITIN